MTDRTKLRIAVLLLFTATVGVLLAIAIRLWRFGLGMG